MKEAKEIVVNNCKHIIEQFAQKHNVAETNLRIRIDLEKINQKPVFGIFDSSTILQRCALKEIIHSAGAKGFSMIVGMYIRNIIKDIFVQSLKHLGLTDPKQIFLLLYLKKGENGNEPMIALYYDGKHNWSLSIAEVMDASLQELK